MPAAGRGREGRGKGRVRGREGRRKQGGWGAAHEPGTCGMHRLLDSSAARHGWRP